MITIILLGLFHFQAAAFAEELSTSYNQEAQKHFLKGQQYYLNSQPVKAEAEFKKALRLNPTLSEAHYYLGSIYFKQDRFMQAKEECAAALEINPQDVNSLIIQGLALHHLGQDGEAVKVFQQAVEVDQNSRAAHSALGLAFCATGDLEKAQEQYYILRQLDEDLAEDLLERIREVKNKQVEEAKE